MEETEGEKRGDDTRGVRESEILRKAKTEGERQTEGKGNKRGRKREREEETKGNRAGGDGKR